jgi:uncharacterized protein (DUF1800 family)
MDTRSAHALVRFGLGRFGTEPYPTDPADWLLAQLKQPDPFRMDPPATTAMGLTIIREMRQSRRDGMTESKLPATYRAQGNASLANAINTRMPFRERLVWFWTNHFTISLRRGVCAAVAGAYVEEAIRPHVTGRFEDMLMAVMRHPAMLIYLDNVASVGPNSRMNARQKRGLNENLARECLELHTVSPAGGYTQTDVTALARILTGWTLDYEAEPPGFVFNPAAHEPGQQTVMGKTFPAGEAGGIAALHFLAHHPATHRFLATKLVRHFVADEPPERAIRQVEGALRDTKGNLGVAAATLVGLEEAWRTPGAKLRTPQELVVAAFRALAGQATPPKDLLQLVSVLGQPLWTAPAPDGWPDQASAWATPEAMMRRIDWSYAFAGRVGQHDPVEIAQAALGPFLRPATRDVIAGAGSRREAMTVLLTSPEFQRR